MQAKEVEIPPLKVGDFAPDFTLDTDGKGRVTLSELRGRNVVIYFYPKDDTPGCTIEAKEFADRNKDFESANTVVIGISKDSIESHDKFKSKYCLPFTLASDDTGSVCSAYCVWVEKNMYGKKYMGIQRASFLVDKHGVIKHIWPNVKAEGHAAEVLEKAKGLR